MYIEYVLSYNALSTCRQAVVSIMRMVLYIKLHYIMLYYIIIHGGHRQPGTRYREQYAVKERGGTSL